MGYGVRTGEKPQAKAKEGEMSEPNWTRAFLARARVTDDPVGDLIVDMRADRNAPPLFKNINAVRGYLRTKNACMGALEAVPGFWRRYQRWIDRHPFAPVEIASGSSEPASTPHSDPETLTNKVGPAGL